MNSILYEVRFCANRIYCDISFQAILRFLLCLGSNVMRAMFSTFDSQYCNILRFLFAIFSQLAIFTFFATFSIERCSIANHIRFASDICFCVTMHKSRVYKYGRLFKQFAKNIPINGMSRRLWNAREKYF